MGKDETNARPDVGTRFIGPGERVVSMKRQLWLHTTRDPLEIGQRNARIWSAKPRGRSF